MRKPVMLLLASASSSPPLGLPGPPASSGCCGNSIPSPVSIATGQEAAAASAPHLQSQKRLVGRMKQVRGGGQGAEGGGECAEWVSGVLGWEQGGLLEVG